MAVMFNYRAAPRCDLHWLRTDVAAARSMLSRSSSVMRIMRYSGRCRPPLHFRCIAPAPSFDTGKFRVCEAAAGCEEFAKFSRRSSHGWQHPDARPACGPP